MTTQGPRYNYGNNPDPKMAKKRYIKRALTMAKAIMKEAKAGKTKVEHD